MIRILIVDDHPAMREGLSAVLRAEPGLVPLAAAESEADLPIALNRTKPDVVLLDYHLPGRDGLALCRQIKRMVPAPAVLLYSAYAGAALAIPAHLAGADGLMHKGVPAPELYDAIRTVARGERIMPPVSHELLQQASTSIDPDDLPILGMVLNDTAVGDIATTLRRDPSDVSARIDRMIQQLRIEVAAPQAANA
jgi:DNA-binding NarL/FixJ family response regulator